MVGDFFAAYSAILFSKLRPPRWESPMDAFTVTAPFSEVEMTAAPKHPPPKQKTNKFFFEALYK